MKKREPIHSFVLLLVLVIAIGAIFLYSNLKFTGYVIGPNNETCDGEWANVTSECINGTQTITWTNITDTTNCVSPIIESQSCEVIQENETCVENWTSTLGTCINGTQTITWTDSANCNYNTTLNQTLYPSSQLCNITNVTNTTVCHPTNCSALGRTCGSVSDGCNGTLSCGSCNSGYTCSSSGTCKVQQETTTAGCGNGNCGVDETCSNCPSDCGTCTAVVGDVCVPQWECGEWQECIDGTQIRTCTDLGQCDAAELTSTESQSCVSEKSAVTQETCSDGIKNQDETGIDCGGSSCSSCNMFTMVGNAVGGSISAGKEFLFGSIPRIVVSTLVLLLIIGGIVAFKLLSDKGITVKDIANQVIKFKDKILKQKFANLPKSENAGGY